METVSSSCVVSVVGRLLVWLESLALRQLLTSGQEIVLFSIHSELPQNSPPKKAFSLPESWHILLNFAANVRRMNTSVHTYRGCTTAFARLRSVHKEETDTNSVCAKSPFILRSQCPVEQWSCLTYWDKFVN